MTKLVSEQLPNDGGYHIKELVDEANERLSKVGKRGKQAKIAPKKTSLALQFTFKDNNGNSQKMVGMGAIPMSQSGIDEAERIANMVTNQLVTNQFTWDWYNKLIGKDTSEKVEVLTCKQMVEEYKKHYFKQKKDNKSPKGSWYAAYRHTENTLGNLDKPISLSLIRQVVERTNNNSVSRKNTLNGLANILKYFDNTDYKKEIKNYKTDNKPKRKKRNVPSDKKIIEVYQTGFVPKLRTPNSFLPRFPQRQFLYGLLATYGLRIHEAWNIANWDKPVTLKNGDWVTVGLEDETEESTQYSGETKIIPAILDPNNQKHILCIKHDTKTGYRMTMPLSPNGHNWIDEFNLLQPLNLPDIENPLKRSGKDEGSHLCANSTCNWFKSHKYGFTPHDLRHAYVHRGHHLGINPKVIADISGHSLIMSNTIYARDMSDSVKYEGMVNAIDREQNKRSENQLLKEEVKTLKAELQTAKNEIELLKIKLQLNTTLKES